VGNTKLIQEALKARELSYSPYSKFKVGAAILTKDDRIFYGANIENASYSLCICAERNALYNAYMNGYKREDIVAMALVADTKNPVSPCGACRQVMSELMLPNTPIYMGSVQKKVAIKTTTPHELLPFAFDGGDF